MASRSFQGTSASSADHQLRFPRLASNGRAFGPGPFCPTVVRLPAAVWQRGQEESHDLLDQTEMSWPSSERSVWPKNSRKYQRHLAENHLRTARSHRISHPPAKSECTWRGGL